MKAEWVEGFAIRTAVDQNGIVISANREGLLSLAKQLTALAEATPGSHIHYDAYNSLEEGSPEMIIEKRAEFRSAERCSRVDSDAILFRKKNAGDM